MSRYVKSRVFKTTFDGDDVAITLKPLEWGDYRDLMRMLRDAPDAEVTDSDELKSRAIDGRILYLDEFRKLMPKYVAGIVGLVDAAGEAVPLELIVSDAYFAPIVSEVFQFCVAKARPENPTKPGEHSTTSSPVEPTPSVIRTSADIPHGNG